MRIATLAARAKRSAARDTEVPSTKKSATREAAPSGIVSKDSRRKAIEGATTNAGFMLDELKEARFHVDTLFECFETALVHAGGSSGTSLEKDARDAYVSVMKGFHMADKIGDAIVEQLGEALKP